MTREELNENKQEAIFKEENRKKTKKIAIKVFKFSLIFIIIFYAFFIYIKYVSTGSIIVKETRITNSTIPSSFNGIKIIHFSDVHYGSNIDINKTKELIEIINKRNPDLVLFSGDLISNNYELDNKEQEALIKELKKINANLGKYAVMGDEDKDNCATIINQSGFTLLNNSYELIYNKNDDAIIINGLDSYLNNNYDIDKSFAYFDSETANANIFTISLFHEPDLTDNILNKHKSNLLLAGHSHNGNIRIPYIGSIFKKEGAKKYDQEFYKISGSNLYVSSGIGTQGDGIRLFCKPSVNFFRISNT